MEIIKISKEEFDTFAETQDYYNIWQTSKYGAMAQTLGYDVEYIAFKNQSKTVGASLILSRLVYMGFRIHYMPRGMIINYSDKDLLKSALNELKRFLFREKSLGIYLDPLILKSTRNRKGEIIETYNTNDIFKIFRRAGADYLERNLYFEGFHPRFYAYLNLTKKSPEKFFKSLSKQTKNKLRKAAKFGVEIFKDQTNNVENLFAFVSNYSKRPITYYQELVNNFKENCEIYYAKVNTEKYVQNSKILYEKEIEDNDYLTNTIQSTGYKGVNMRTVLNKKMESDKVLASFKQHMVTSTDLLRNHPEGLVIGAVIVIREKNTIHFFEEYQDKNYRNLNALTLLRWKILEKYLELNIDKIDFGAVTGEFDKTKNSLYGLTEAKTAFQGQIEEYIGEFGIIINKTMYSLYAGSDEKQTLTI